MSWPLEGRNGAPEFTGDADFAEVRCPHCAGADLEVASLFGGSISEVLFQCRSCRSHFNWIKWRGRMPPTAARPEA